MKRVKDPETKDRAAMPSGLDIPRWLEEHGASLEASLAFESWLSAGGDRELIQPFLTPWLEQHGESLEASFVLKSWLLAKGDLERVRPFLTPWLIAHGDQPEAELVFNSWLSAKGDREVIGQFVKPWLQLHGEKPEAQFFFSSWLSTGGKYKRVQPFLIQWLSLHGQDLGASYVLKSWLDAGGDPALVRPFVGSWLALHGDTPEATFIFRPWLEAGGDFELIREPALRWFRAYRESFEARFVVRSLGRQRDLPLEIVRDVLAWCRRFARHQQALWTLTGLGHHLWQGEIAEEVAQTARLLTEPALQEAKVPLITKLLVVRLFGILAKDPQLRSETSPLFLSWLRRPELYRYDPSRLSSANILLHDRSQSPSILLYVKELLDAGALAVDRDRATLRRFFAWTGTWDPGSRDKARRFLVGLMDAAASGSPEPGDNLFGALGFPHGPLSGA
jgi:hypothetical protein